jgi:hypothetical protein
VNWHQLIDKRAFEMDEVIAKILRSDPTKLELVEDWIKMRLADPDYSEQSKDALAEWVDLIGARGLDGVLEQLADRSEDGDRMRQSSPFGIIMPQEERSQILRRYEALRTGTHPSRLQKHH